MIVQVLGKQIGCTVNSKDIDGFHLVSFRHSAEVMNLFLRFVMRKLRNQFYVDGKKASLSTEHLSSSCDSKPAFVNEPLTPENKRLLAEAAKKRKELQFFILIKAKPRREKK